MAEILIRKNIPRLVFFGVLGLLVARVMLQVELPMLLGMNEAWDKKIEPYRLILHVHAMASAIALFVSPFQFFGLQSNTGGHRWRGWIYVSAVLVGSITGMWIAANHLPESEKFSAFSQAVLWLWLTAASVMAVLRKDVLGHRIWMYRSYALTTTFVITRLLLDVFHYRPGEAIGGIPGLIWMSSLVTILLADVMVPHQEH